MNYLLIYSDAEGNDELALAKADGPRLAVVSQYSSDVKPEEVKSRQLSDRVTRVTVRGEVWYAVVA